MPGIYFLYVICDKRMNHQLIKWNVMTHTLNSRQPAIEPFISASQHKMILRAVRTLRHRTVPFLCQCGSTTFHLISIARFISNLHHFIHNIRTVILGQRSSYKWMSYITGRRGIAPQFNILDQYIEYLLLIFLFHQTSHQRQSLRCLTAGTIAAALIIEEL